MLQFFLEKKVHELYTFCLGFVVLWMIWRAFLFFAENFRRFLTGGLLNAFKSFAWSLYSLAKLLYAAMLLGAVLPLIAGNYTSTLLLPFSVQPYQTPILFFLLNWASGVLNLRMFLLLIELFPSFLKQAKEKLVRDGLWNIDLVSLNLHLALPVLATLLILLLVPLHLSLFLFATLGYSMLDCWNMQKWVPLASWLIPLSCLAVLRIGSWMKGVARGIRDEVYLIGRRLHNLER